MIWVGFYTLCRREIDRFLRIWRETLFPPAITMALYFIIFGNLVGSQIAPIHGFSYMQYIAPGLIMMSIISNSFINTVTSVYLLRFQKSIEEILVSPLPNIFILLGFTFGGIMRGFVIGALVMGLSLFFTHLTVHHIFLMFLTVLLTSALFSLGGFLNGLYAKSFDHISVFPTFVLTPLTYLGGVFYSVSMLPPFWQKISLLNPILYLVNAFRYSLLGVTDIPITYSLLFVSIVIAILFGLNYFLLSRGVGLRT